MDSVNIKVCACVCACVRARVSLRSRSKTFQIAGSRVFLPLDAGLLWSALLSAAVLSTNDVRGVYLVVVCRQRALSNPLLFHGQTYSSLSPRTAMTAAPRPEERRPDPGLAPMLPPCCCKRTARHLLHPDVPLIAGPLKPSLPRNV